MTSRPEHVQRRADPSGATLISVEVDPHCTPQWTESGRGLQRSPFTWMGSEAGTQPLWSSPPATGKRAARRGLPFRDRAARPTCTSDRGAAAERSMYRVMVTDR